MQTGKLHGFLPAKGTVIAFWLGLHNYYENF
jgi:hypothetical protein